MLDLLRDLADLRDEMTHGTVTGFWREKITSLLEKYAKAAPGTGDDELPMCRFECGPCRDAPGPWHQRGCARWREAAPAGPDLRTMVKKLRDDLRFIPLVDRLTTGGNDYMRGILAGRLYASECINNILAAECAAPKAEGTSLEGSWPADDPRKWFVDGAKWWEFRKTGATMWQSDRNEAEAEADRRKEGAR